jgi:deoxyribodipyrimidine photo-lyase
MNVDPRRVITHKTTDTAIRRVVYRMSRDQRVSDNWALIFAQEQALLHRCPLEVVFTLTPSYPFANMRHYSFMLQGLKEVEQELSDLNIPFRLILNEDPTAAFEQYVRSNGINLIVSDFDPLHIKRRWVEAINQIEGIAHYEVDAHNIVPCRWVSQKVEFGAYTIRPKIKRALEEFLTEFPSLKRQEGATPLSTQPTDWQQVEASIHADSSVKPIEWLESGEASAIRSLNQFIEQKLDGYSQLRNNPTLDGQSNLSPFLHFGQLSAQRIAIEVSRRATASPDSEAFLEELIVRRELSDNFCFYNPKYDSADGFPDWAKKDIEQHRGDPRELVYATEQLEQGLTHDPLWNAAQAEMVKRGKMHGYMRMYWAKKILEWTPSAKEALATTIYLNDKYSIDGRDPNGYAGIAWSIGGVHDRAWFPRPIFGKIRYMSYNGCRSKFDVEAYIRMVAAL